MTKRKLTIPILLILTLSILSQTLIPSPAAADPVPWIFLDPESTVDESGSLATLTVYVKTNYTGTDIWGYDFTLTYNPLILSGVSVTNGPVISTPEVVWTEGFFNNTIGELEITEASSLNTSADLPYPPLNNTNTGVGILATVLFNVVGNNGETPITLGPETQLKNVTDHNVVDGHLHPERLGHSYFRRGPVPSHDVAATGIAMHHSLPATTVFNETSEVWTYVNATIENQGTVTELFDVWIYYVRWGYPTTIKEETVTVPAAGDTTVEGGFNITDLFGNLHNLTHPRWGVPIGNLTIVVEASAVYNEVATSNNNYSITLVVKVPGDVQGDDPGTPGDGDVDRYDYGAFAMAYGYLYPNAKYNSETDFNRNGKADRYDYGRLAWYYGEDFGAYKPL
jgi:hypothetical protein